MWVRNVLPGLGIDRVRLIEVAFPPPLPEIGNAAAQFDEAQRAFDLQDYTDCVGKCRGLIRAWNRQLGASKQKHLAQIIGERCGWHEDDPRYALLDSVWQGLLGVVSAPLHQEDQPKPFRATAEDARLHLMLTWLSRSTSEASCRQDVCHQLPCLQVYPTAAKKAVKNKRPCRSQTDLRFSARRWVWWRRPRTGPACPLPAARQARTRSISTRARVSPAEQGRCTAYSPPPGDG